MVALSTVGITTPALAEKAPVSIKINVEEERASLRLVVRSAGYTAQRNTILQQGNKDKISIVSVLDPSGLEFVLVSDQSTTSKVMDSNHIAALGLSTDQAVALGRKQVLATLPSIPEYSDVDEGVITSPNIDYIASLFLAEGWDRLNVSLGGNLIVAIPSDDIIVISGPKTTDERAKLKDYVKLKYDDANRAVSDALYTRKDGKWMALHQEDQAVARGAN